VSGGSGIDVAEGRRGCLAHPHRGNVAAEQACLSWFWGLAN